MIELINLKKRFGDKWITRGVNLKIPDYQMTCIIGRSGEGKSVLLKQIIGLIKPTSGSILVDGKDITILSETELHIEFEKFGYVFQFAALLDSLNILENIGIKLFESNIPKEEILRIVKEKLVLVNLSPDILYRYPAEISGGMKKRVGLARTLIGNPQIILYDEPTTGLDPINSRVIHELMYDMQKRYNITSVVITHDLDILNYADNIVLLYEGQVRYFGNARNAWESENPYIYQFLRGLSEGPIKTELPER